MMTFGNFKLLIWVSAVMCLLWVSLGFQPVDNYLIDCGSPTNTSVGSRVFLADNLDSYNLSTLENLFANTNSKSLQSTYGLALYQTARILNRTIQFQFSIKKPGRHWVRLHFFPFVHETYKLSEAKFSVSVQNFKFLRDYQIQNDSVVKEYSLNITSDKLILTFTPSSKSFAFVNALEVVSVPDELISDGGIIVDPQVNPPNLQNQAIETVARVNMGNQTVSPENDTLWRLWVPDGTYLKHSFVKFVSKIDAVNYTGGKSSEDIAPYSVYGTATMLDTERDPNLKANVTWVFNVDPGFHYLVRFHLCNIVCPPPEEILFNVYINSWLVSKNVDPSNSTSNTFGTPYYIDAVTRISDSHSLNISVEPFTLNFQYPNAILNGLEIMKMNNSKGSLDALDSDVKNSKIKSGMVVGLSVGVVFVVLLLASALFLLCRRRRKLSHVGHSMAQDQFARNREGNFHPKKDSNSGYRFPFVVIQEATENFSESLVIGVGGFGKVYKGVLKDETKVAVKRGAPQSSQGLAEFRTEIEMLSQFRHRHLVSLIGYCDEKNEMIIIYEYMENGTLKNHLYGSDLPRLSWRQRLEICIGSARGLHYLHTGTAKAIIHRDVKSANILVDENLMAKVADFGLSKTGPDIDQTHVSTAVKGSFGYLDPEYLTRQQLTEKSDVYSFGVVLFEVLCGRPVIDPSLPRDMVSLVEWAMKWLKSGELEKIIDPYLVGKTKPDSLRKFGETAEKCLAECGTNRPSMGDVLWNLECALNLQGDEIRSRLNDDQLALQLNNANHFEDSAQFSMGSAGDLAEVSMSRVFSQMMKAEMR